VREDPNPASDFAIWAGEKVTDFEVRWGDKDDADDYDLEVLIKRFPNCEEYVEYVITEASLYPRGLKQSTTAQSMALEWLKEVADCDVDFEWQWIQAYALATLYYSTIHPPDEDWTVKTLWPPAAADSNVCKPVGAEWFGITCSGQDVTVITLPDNNLVGTITPEIGLLTSLRKHAVLSLLFVVVQ